MSDAETPTETDAIVSEEVEAATASAPDRSEDDTAAGVASASEQPDASEASREHRSAGTAGRERSEPQPSSDEPDASDSEPAS